MTATARRHLGLSTVLLVLAGTLGLGLAHTGACADGDWRDGRQYRLLCYSDLVPLLGAEQLAGSRLPYLDPCADEPGRSCDEYPVLTMYTMRVAAWIDGGLPGFFFANAFLLAAAAVLAVVSLYLLAGDRALYVAAAPTLLLYAFVNWDLLAVGLATAATLAFLNRRDVGAGVLLGLGAAAKLYPALLVIPFVLHRVREREPDAGIHLAWAAAGTWIVMNLPLALWGTDGWLEFFRLNAERPSDWDSLWTVACHALSEAETCGRTGTVNLASAVGFLVLATLVAAAKARRHPGYPRWTLAFPLLIVFLLTNKVYSPQYSLWLLPWFALALPDLRWFAAFSATDAAVFVTRFAWFGERSPDVGGWVDAVTVGWFHAALQFRALVLVGCVIAWILREPEPIPGEIGAEPVAAGMPRAAGRPGPAEGSA